MPRPLLGDRPLTNTERCRRHRAAKAAQIERERRAAAVLRLDVQAAHRALAAGEEQRAAAILARALERGRG